VESPLCKGEEEEMQGNIYFFSGSGNSYAIAKELASVLDCRLISIDNTDFEQRLSNEAIFGLVFPVYHASYGGSGLPFIVRDFIAHIDDLSQKTIFVVCTHSGVPGYTIENVKKAIEEKHGKLMIGLSVKMTPPFSTFEKITHMITGKPLLTDAEEEKTKRSVLYEEWENRKTTLLESLRNETVKIEKTSGLKKAFLKLLFFSQKGIVQKRFRRLSQQHSDDLETLLKSSDTNFKVTGDCNGCGICSKVCPVSNITIEGIPKWHHQCELCFACFQWCPRQAITGEIVEFEKRYHHPDITLNEMVNRKKETVEDPE
jgi:ferredoxin/flavodoxin